MEERLDDLKQIFTPFLESGEVSKVFINILFALSTSVATDSVMSQALHDKQLNFTAFLKATRDEFTQKRGNDFDQKPT